MSLVHVTEEPWSYMFTLFYAQFIYLVPLNLSQSEQMNHRSFFQKLNDNLLHSLLSVMVTFNGGQWLVDTAEHIYENTPHKCFLCIIWSFFYFIAKYYTYRVL